MSNATETPAAAPVIRFGSIVHYHGSKTEEHGLYKVAGRTQCSHGLTYELVTYIHPGYKTPALSHVSPGSVTYLKPSDIRTRTCRARGCHCEYFLVDASGVRINTDGCPMCALTEAVLS